MFTSKFYKENHCVICPKVFCCPSCRYKHENAVHQIRKPYVLIDFAPKPINCNFCKQIRRSRGSLINCNKVDYLMFKPMDIIENPKDHLITPIGKLENSTENDSLSTNICRRPFAPNKLLENMATFSKKCDLQIGATSTPYLDESKKKKINFDALKSTLHKSIENIEESKDSCDKEESAGENATETVNVSTEVDEELCTIEDIKSNRRVSFCITSNMESKNSTDTETIESTEQSEATDRSNNSYAEKEEIGIANVTDTLDPNEMFDLNGDTTLWASAWSADENEDPKENSSSSSVDIIHFKSTCVDLEGNEDTCDAENVSEVKKDSSTSSPNISNRVWQTITTSIISALNSTKDMCSFKESFSKRSLEDVGDSCSEPSAKRPKYGCTIKCRPPIHEIDTIVFSRMNKKPILLFSKATQTEECYFK